MAEFTKLGKYEIRRELGRGAMGVVYEGYDPLIERVVALKTIRADQLVGDNARDIIARFRREAQAAGRLTHPNIVSIYDFGEDAGVWYIAMEFIKGRELKEYFEANERFTTADAVRILTQILSALGYSHKLGVIHRDIKPANIILLADGSVKVADFGIAHIESSELTQVGAVLGTPSYMSPEQIQGLPIDGRSDLFSVGVILYQFLTGERPFTGSSTITMRKVLEENPLPPSRFNVQIPGAMDAVVRKALEKRADDRYQTAEEFTAALQAAAKPAPAGSSDPTLIVPPRPTHAPGSTLAGMTAAMADAPPVRVTAEAAPPSPPPAAAQKSRTPAIAVVGGRRSARGRRGRVVHDAAARRRHDASVRRAALRRSFAAGGDRASECATGCRGGGAQARSRQDRDFRHRHGRPERRALPERQGAAAKRPARRFAQPVGREGAGADGGQGVAREELRLGEGQAPVEERQLRHRRGQGKRAAGRQGRPHVHLDRGRRRRQGGAEVAEPDVARRAHRVHPRERRPPGVRAHRRQATPTSRARRRFPRRPPRTSSRSASSRSASARGRKAARAPTTAPRAPIFPSRAK